MRNAWIVLLIFLFSPVSAGADPHITPQNFQKKLGEFVAREGKMHLFVSQMNRKEAKLSSYFDDTSDEALRVLLRGFDRETKRNEALGRELVLFLGSRPGGQSVDQLDPAWETFLAKTRDTPTPLLEPLVKRLQGRLSSFLILGNLIGATRIGDDHFYESSSHEVLRKLTRHFSELLEFDRTYDSFVGERKGRLLEVLESGKGINFRYGRDIGHLGELDSFLGVHETDHLLFLLTRAANDLRDEPILVDDLIKATMQVYEGPRRLTWELSGGHAKVSALLHSFVEILGKVPHR